MAIEGGRCVLKRGEIGMKGGIGELEKRTKSNLREESRDRASVLGRKEEEKEDKKGVKAEK